jgi:phosphatidylethanolamine/phosphatidyl-N-methylethanolamine N-methyltransferase
MDFLTENFVFLRESFLSFKTTGALFPTSRWSAEAMTRALRQPGREPLRILELGPGTGSVTVQILADMVSGDTLTVCEINPRFMESLKERLSKDVRFLRHNECVKFFLGPIQEMPEDGAYDLIVCAIPFLNFPPVVVEQIFAKLRRISTPDTLMTFFEYMGLKRIGKAMAARDRRENLEQLEEFMRERVVGKRPQMERVWLNVLPIKVFTIKPAA